MDPERGNYQVTDLADLTASELINLFSRKEASPVEAVEACLKRIAAVEPEVNAIIYLAAEQALDQARESTRRFAQGGVRPLEGVPYGLKDVIATAGVATTGGSKLYRDHVPGEDAVINARLAEAGAILLAKLQTAEMACGSQTSEQYDGRMVRNPWDISRTSGGSSSGSGAAVGAREMPIALGTDSGGSTRHPAAFCGVYGLKPTHGRVPRHGVMQVSWTMDEACPMARSVEDVARVLEVIAGSDPRDPRSHPAPIPHYVDAVTHSIKGLRIGRIRALEDRLHPKVLATFEAGLGVLSDAGAVVVDVDIPSIHLGETCLWLTVIGEFSSSHELHFPTIEERDELYASLLQASAFISLQDYLRALRVRVLIQREVEAAFEHCDALAAPSMPSVAPLIEDMLCDLGTEKVPLLSVAGRTHAVFTVTGNPALAVPAGFIDGLPVAFQLIGRPYDEETVFKLAAAFERATDYRNMLPPILTKAS